MTIFITLRSSKRLIRTRIPIMSITKTIKYIKTIYPEFYVRSVFFMNGAVYDFNIEGTGRTTHWRNALMKNRISNYTTKQIARMQSLELKTIAGKPYGSPNILRIKEEFKNANS